jgi:excisionase family DNA binding protein
MEAPTSSNVTRTRPTPQHLKRHLAPIAEAADYIGANPRTIRRYIAAGRLTGYRVGPRLIRVDLDELEALLRPIPAVSA